MNNKGSEKKVELSVIVPIYNMEKYLSKCINSILIQTFSNMEILLIDDGSEDSSSEICDYYSKKDKRIKVFHKKNGGLSDAKNFGINKAIGKYITFVDSDDWIDTNMYSNMMNYIKQYHADIAICGRYIDYEDGTSTKWFNKSFLEMNNKEALISLNSFNNFDMASWDKIYNRNLFKKIRFPVGKKCEDAYTTYLLFDKSNIIIYIPECYYHYFQRNGSISRGQSLNIDYIFAAKDQMNFFKKYYPDLVYIAETNYVFSIKSIFQVSVRQNIKFDSKFKMLVQSAKKFKKSVYSNNYISFKKKLTYTLFAYFNSAYYVLLKLKYFLVGDEQNDQKNS